MPCKIPKAVLEDHVQCIIEPHETMQSARRRAREELEELYESMVPTPQRRPRKPSGIATDNVSGGAGASASPASCVVAGSTTASVVEDAMDTTRTKQHGGQPRTQGGGQPRTRCVQAQCKQGGGQPRKRRGGAQAVVGAASVAAPACNEASGDTNGEDTHMIAGAEAASARQGADLRPCDHVALGDADTIVPKRRRWASDTVHLQDGKFVVVNRGNVAASSQDDVPSERAPKVVEPIEVPARAADGARQLYNKGDAVMFVGLKQTHLNGKVATVKFYDEACRRWIVQVPGKPRQSNVKPENLELFCINSDTLPRFNRSSDSSHPLTATELDASSVAGPVMPTPPAAMETQSVAESELDESGDVSFEQHLDSRPSQHAGSDSELDAPIVLSCFPLEHAAVLAPRAESEVDDLSWQQLVGSTPIKSDCAANVTPTHSRHRTMLVRCPSSPRRYNCDVVNAETLFDDMFSDLADEVVALLHAHIVSEY